jgi:hypothetical protein
MNSDLLLDVQDLPLSDWLQRLGCLDVEQIQEYYDALVPAVASCQPSKRNHMSSRERLDAVLLLAARDGWICHYCSIKLIPVDRESEFCYEVNGEWFTVEGYAFHHLEHKTPKCRGGGNEIENLTLSCPPCNSRKGKKTEAEFMEYLSR